MPLAFVTVLVKETKAGVSTDIDGKFSIGYPPGKITLTISHIGYTSRSVMINSGESGTISIALQSAGKQLENVIITSGENPANRIMRLVQQNKKLNNPEAQPYFKYNAYTIAALSGGPRFWNMNKRDTGKIKKPLKVKVLQKPRDTAADRLAEDLARRFKENHLMLTESYTQRIFRFPNQSKETVLATKVSGLKSAAFALTASNFQPFGFYKEYLQMNQNAFLSPLADHSLSMYTFRLTDIIPRETDTSFIISFRPKDGKNFNGLKGMLYISSDGYAIENVIASPADEYGLIFTFRIQQKYNKVNEHWFPTQLNSTLTQKDLATDSSLLFWDTKSYISNVEIGMSISKKSFSNVELEYHPLAGKRNDSAWTLMRADTLNVKEKATYETFQLLPPKFTNGIENVNKVMQVLSIEGIPLGVVDLPFKYILSGINRYETFRIGAGIKTNPGLSKLFTIDGFLGYGLKDKAWKYGSALTVNMDERTATSIRFDYSRNIQEPGNVDYFVRNSSVFTSQTLRNFQASRMDSIEQVKIEFNTRIRPSLQVNTWLLNEQRSPALYPYYFKDDVSKVTYRAFTNSEIGIGFRLTRGETFIKMGRAKMRNKPATTQLLVQLARGIDLWQGRLAYTKMAIQLNHHFHLMKFGQTSFQLEAGQVWGNVPYSYLYNTKASKSENKISVHIPNTFQTVGLYEFVSDRSVALFLQQNFGSLLFKPSSLSVRPEISLVQNISYGSLNKEANHRNLNAKVPSHGLYESGILVKNLYRKSFYSICYIGLGGGVFYRYGAYSLPNAADNWIFKWGFNISF